MQDTVDLPLSQRAGDGFGEARGLDHAIDNCGDEGDSGRRKLAIAGAVFTGEVEERLGGRAEPIAKDRGKGDAVALRALHVGKSGDAGGLCGMGADREGGELCEAGASGVAGDGARRVGAGHHHPRIGAIRHLER